MCCIFAGRCKLTTKTGFQVSADDLADEELDDAQENHANLAMDNGFKCVWLHHTAQLTLFYKICNHMFRSVSAGRARRCNIINILICLTNNNCHDPYHMAGRYAPQLIGLVPLLRRILKEAVSRFEQELEEGMYLEYFCVCSAVRQFVIIIL